MSENKLQCPLSPYFGDTDYEMSSRCVKGECALWHPVARVCAFMEIAVKSGMIASTLMLLTNMIKDKKKEVNKDGRSSDG